MKSIAWVSVPLAVTLIGILLFHSLIQTASPKASPAAGARRYGNESNVDLREHVDEVFARADACACQQKIDEAITLYQQGLQVDPWRLEYQLKLARLLKQIGLEEQAVEKALVVRRYTEQQDLRAAAEELIRDSNMPQEGEEPPAALPVASSLEIVMVPIEDVDTGLLSELRQAMQTRLGIRFTVAEEPLTLGGMDRSYAANILAKLVERIKATMPERQYQFLLQRLGLTEESLKQYHPQMRFVEAALRDSGRDPAQIAEFRATLETLRHTGQYDADRLLAKLRQAHPLPRSGPVKGYLGITEADLFARDYNYLFGWGRPGYGVMSYHRYTAAFNEAPPNRPKLLERTFKQAISTTFYILDIPRCTSPACVRAYPHSLVEHDQKPLDLCPDCRRALALAIARNR
jgi:predicted Zn-dependent protease